MGGWTGRRRVALALAALVALGLAWRFAAPASRAPDGARRHPEPPHAGAAARDRPRPRPPAGAPDPAPEAASEPLPDGVVRVTCAVGRAFEGWPMLDVRLAFDAGGPVAVRPVGFTHQDGVLAFEADAEAPFAIVTWGMGPDAQTVARWDEAGACRVERLPEPVDAALYGRVRGAERLDDGTVFLEGCGIEERGEPAPLDVDGGFFVPVQQGRCRIRAWRRAGALRLPGAWTTVDARAGADAEVTLEVPTFAPAGLGLGFQPLGDGIRVEQVHEGTPAWDAGLEAGDVIASVDGVATDGMDAEDFLQVAIGPDGTAAHLTGTTADGEPFDVTLRRKPIAIPSNW